MAATPIRRTNTSEPSIGMETLEDGSVLLTNGDPLRAYQTQWGDMLRRWAGERHSSSRSDGHGVGVADGGVAPAPARHAGCANRRERRAG